MQAQKKHRQQKSGHALLGEIQNWYEQNTAAAKKICPDYSGGNDRNFRGGKTKFELGAEPDGILLNGDQHLG
jgi:hypothetical protein